MYENHRPGCPCHIMPQTAAPTPSPIWREQGLNLVAEQLRDQSATDKLIAAACVGALDVLLTQRSALWGALDFLSRV